MNQAYLLQTARQLRPPKAEAAVEFESRQQVLAEELNRVMSARPDLEGLIGPGNLAMMQENSRNFCRFMSILFQVYEPEVLTQTALWVFRAYRSHGFQPAYWTAYLGAFVEILHARVSPATYQEVYPFFQWLIVNVPALVKISDEQLGVPLGPPPAHPGGDST
jgi:hypothetical protein